MSDPAQNVSHGTVERGEVVEPPQVGVAQPVDLDLVPERPREELDRRRRVHARRAGRGDPVLVAAPADGRGEVEREDGDLHYLSPPSVCAARRSCAAPSSSPSLVRAAASSIAKGMPSRR